MLAIVEVSPVNRKELENRMIWLFGISKRDAREEIDAVISHYKIEGLIKYEKGIIIGIKKINQKLGEIDGNKIL